MTVVEGYRCDQCGSTELQPKTFGRISDPAPARGYFVQRCHGDDTNASRPLWLCSTGCVVGYMATGGRDG